MNLTEMGEIETQGELKTTTIPKLIHYFYRHHKTGAFLLKRDGIKKCILFHKGYPLDVRSNLVSECLGQFLSRQGKITREALEASLRIMAITGEPQGIVFTEMGLLSPMDLGEYLREQIEYKLFSTFDWKRGEYSFVERDDVLTNQITLDLSPANLIMKGVKARLSVPFIKNELKDMENRYLVVSDDPFYQFQDLKLSEKENTLLNMIDGKSILAQILSNSPLDLKSTHHIIYTLLCIEMFKLSDMPRDSTRLIPAPEEDEGGYLSRQEKEVRERLIKQISRISKQNYFEMLGVSEEDDTETIKDAYFKLSRQYHPDKFSGASDEIKGHSDEIFKQLNTAYNTLTNDEDRAEYVRSLREGKEERKDDASDIITAEVQFQKGVDLVKRNDFKKAIKSFQWATELNPNEAEYLSYLGWATFKATTPSTHLSRDKAKKLLKKSIALNPKLDTVYIFLGHIFNSEGNIKAAEIQFKKALQANPHNVEATRELKFIAKKREKERGLFDKFKERLK